MSTIAHLDNSLSIHAISGADSLHQYSELLNMSFCPEGRGNYLDDFPVWNPTWNPNGTIPDLLRLGVFSGKQLVCTAAMRLAQIRIPGVLGEIPIAILGAVATRPDQRNRGLASQLVQQLDVWAKQKQAIMTVLWSSEYRLYHRLGFDWCGEQIRMNLKDILEQTGLPVSSNQSVMVGWHPSLFKKIQNRKDGLILGDRDQCWFEAHQNVEWYTVRSSNEIQAYVALGRGIDLQNHIHEWGGDRDTVLHIFKYIMDNRIKSRGENLVKNHIKNLALETIVLGSEIQFKKIGISTQLGLREPLCLAKVYDMEKFQRLSSQQSLLALPLWFWGLDSA